MRGTALAVACVAAMVLTGCSTAEDGTAAGVTAAEVAVQDGGSADGDAADDDDDTETGSDVTSSGVDTAPSETEPPAAPGTPTDIDFCAGVSAAEFEAIFGVPVDTTEAAAVTGAQLGGCTLTSAFDPDKPMTMAMVAARSDDFDELVSFYAEGGKSVTVTGADDAWFNPTTGVMVRGDGALSSFQFVGNPDLMSGATSDEAASIAVAEAFLN